MDMTAEQRAAATAGILEHLGKLVLHAQGDDPTIGAVTVTFHQSGQFNLGYVGTLDKALTLGALTDAMLTFREIVNSKQVGDQMLGLMQSLNIPANRKN